MQESKTSDKDWSFEVYTLLGYRIVDEEESRKKFNDWVNKQINEAKKEEREKIIKFIKKEHEPQSFLFDLLVDDIKEQKHLGERKE